MTDSHEREFRRRLRWTPPRPSSPLAGYVAAAAVAALGMVTLLGARSRPMYLSGWLILAGSTFAAVYIWAVSRRRGRNPRADGDLYQEPMSNAHLSLYHFEGCPYCRLVRRAIAELGLQVELRDIHASPDHLRELVAATGRRTVPVLRIDAGGDVDFLPESRDIVVWLRRWAASAARNQAAPAP
jgi:glutaredoxin